MDYYSNIFNNYYHQFDNNEYWIKYKHDHIMRVVDYATKIANSLNVSNEDLELIKICALFHDIARFKQYATYHCFEDASTFDHGDEGYNILKELGIDNYTILECTKNHNKYKVDESLDEKTKFITSIIRDADKVDIIIDLHNELDDDEKTFDITDNVMNCFKNHQLLQNQMDNWNSSLFRILRCMAFIFDLNYQESFKIIKKADQINFKCNNILKRFNDDRVNEIRNILNNYIDEKVSD